MRNSWERGPLAEENLAAVKTPLRGSTVGQSAVAAPMTRALVVYEETQGPSADEERPVETPPSQPAALAEEEVSAGQRRWTWLQGRALARRQRILERRAGVEPVPHLISLPELIQPSLVEQHRHYLCVHQETSEYSRARAVIGYPRTLLAGWFDRLLSLDEPYGNPLKSLEDLGERFGVE